MGEKKRGGNGGREGERKRECERLSGEGEVCREKEEKGAKEGRENERRKV